MGPDFGGEPLPFLLRHIRGITDDEISPAFEPQAAEGAEEISGGEPDVAGPVEGGVSLGHAESSPADVGRDDAGSGDFLGQGHGEAPASCPDIDDQRIGRLDELQGPLDDQLGLRAGDQHGRGDGEGNGPEFLFPQDVGQGDAAAAVLDRPQKTPGGRGRHRPAGKSEDLEVGEPGRPPQEHPGFQIGIDSREGAQAGDRPADQLGGGHRSGPPAARASSSRRS